MFIQKGVSRIPSKVTVLSNSKTKHVSDIDTGRSTKSPDDGMRKIREFGFPLMGENRANKLKMA